MAIESREPHEPRSLAEQIADAERRIVERRQWIAKRRVFLAQHIRQRATSPAALLLAGSLGFIVGELTRDNKNAFFEGEPVRAASPLLQVAGNAMEWNGYVPFSLPNLASSCRLFPRSLPSK